MLIEKSELAQKIGKLKSVVPKKSVVPVMQSILLKDGYLIGSNQEITVKAKLEVLESELENETFLIPAKAFDLISNLPDGEMSISADKNNSIMICSGKIKNTFQSIDPQMFNSSLAADTDEQVMTVDSQELKKCMSHVLYAVSSIDSNKKMSSMCLDCHDGWLNFIGLDGHLLAWDKLKYEGTFKLLIPKGAVEKILSLDIVGPVEVTYTKLSAVFKTDEYIVETRLVDGDYFKYEQMFGNLDYSVTANRKMLLESVNRASLCTVDKEPIHLDFVEENVKVYLTCAAADYSEVIRLESPIQENMQIAFDSRLLMNTLKAFSDDELEIQLRNSTSPMLIQSSESNLISLVLPVNTR